MRGHQHFQGGDETQPQHPRHPPQEQVAGLPVVDEIASQSMLGEHSLQRQQVATPVSGDAIPEAGRLHEFLFHHRRPDADQGACPLGHFFPTHLRYPQVLRQAFR